MTDRIDEALKQRAVRVANRHTRRGFLARVGAGAAALSTGGLVAHTSTAQAVCSGQSTTCYQLYGVNGCRSSHCEDGSWCVSSGCDNIESCGRTRWRDCCVPRSGCACANAGSGVTCCNGCVYGDSCSSATHVVRCRYHTCC